MSSELKPCPFCQKMLYRRDGINPYAVCVTDDCFGKKMPIVSLDDQPSVDAWNRRAIPAAPETHALGSAETQAAIKLGAAVLSKIEDAGAREVAIRNALTEASKSGTFSLLPIWRGGGLGDRLLEAMHAYCEDYVYSPDEGWDHEPTDFERLLLEDFLNGALSTDRINTILQEAASAALPRVQPAIFAALRKPLEPSKEQIEHGIQAYREGVYLTDEQVYASVSSIVRAALLPAAPEPAEDRVEEVARAMALADGKDPDKLSHNSFQWWRHYVPQARAAIKVLCVARTSEEAR